MVYTWKSNINFTIPTSTKTRTHQVFSILPKWLLFKIIILLMYDFALDWNCCAFTFRKVLCTMIMENFILSNQTFNLKICSCWIKNSRCLFIKNKYPHRVSLPDSRWKKYCLLWNTITIFLLQVDWKLPFNSLSTWNSNITYIYVSPCSQVNHAI